MIQRAFRAAPAVLLPALLAVACADQPAAVTTSSADPAPAAPAAAPVLTASAPEPGVVLEPLEVVTPRGVHRFQVEIADTDEERQLGLMNRRSMARDRGMLFLFQGPPRRQAFWMRNTLIPLDIIYIAADGRIDSIVNAVPLDETPLPSSGPSSYVLEINGGLAAELGIAPGDRVRHKALPGE